MSRFGRTGPPEIVDTYSLLILNVSFRTSADDLYPLFDKCGKVFDIFIPKDRRTGESRGFAFVRYKYAEDAQRAVDRLDGRVVDGRAIAVQFAKYGPNAERIHQGRVIEKLPAGGSRSRSRSPPRRYRDEYHRDRDYGGRSRDRYEHDRYQAREREYHYRSRSHSASRDYDRGRGRVYDDEAPAYGRGHGNGQYDDERRRSLGRSFERYPHQSSLSPSPGRRRPVE